MCTPPTTLILNCIRLFRLCSNVARILRSTTRLYSRNMQIGDSNAPHSSLKQSLARAFGFQTYPKNWLHSNLEQSKQKMEHTLSVPHYQRFWNWASYILGQRCNIQFHDFRCIIPPPFSISRLHSPWCFCVLSVDSLAMISFRILFSITKRSRKETIKFLLLLFAYPPSKIRAFFSSCGGYLSDKFSFLVPLRFCLGHSFYHSSFAIEGYWISRLAKRVEWWLIGQCQWEWDQKEFPAFIDVMAKVSWNDGLWS